MVVADIEGGQLGLVVAKRMSRERERDRRSGRLEQGVRIWVITYIFLKSFNLRKSIVAEVKLFEIDETFKTTHLGDSVRLNGQDLQVAEGVQVLYGTRYM